MLADLERCVGCQTCTAACRHANATSPAVQWRKVLDVELGTYPDVSRTFVPVGCQHCADPPCMHVCPTTATGQRQDGIVTIDYDICIGCAYCDVACPYQARFKIDVARFAYAEGAMQHELARERPDRIGVAQKCTFCSDRIDYGHEHGLTPGVHPDATPACVNACIADALHFGDIEDYDSNVSRMLRQHQHFRMHEELSTDPGFYYLYDHAPAGERSGLSRRDRASAPADTPESGSAPGNGGGRIRTRGVEPWHQQHWDWKAAANFLGGGAGSGLAAAAAAASFAGFPVAPLLVAASALMALGLFFVLLKIGRKLRFLHVLRQPRRSWMAREAWVATFYFPAALAAILLDSPLAVGAAALLALAFLVCQAMILFEAKAIPAWRVPETVPLLIATGLAEGAGLFLAAASIWQPLHAAAPAAAWALAVLLAARAIAFVLYRQRLKEEGAPVRALAALDGMRLHLLAFGLVLPLLLLLTGILDEQAASVLFPPIGAMALLSGWLFKAVLVTRAGYNQGFALVRTPVRGAGSAGPPVKPGWSVPEPPAPWRGRQQGIEGSRA
jgi:phenylacetyl-CoA:acceptor oxidoreductase subunit 1